MSKFTTGQKFAIAYAVFAGTAVLFVVALQIAKALI